MRHCALPQIAALTAVSADAALVDVVVALDRATARGFPFAQGLVIIVQQIVLRRDPARHGVSLRCAGCGEDTVRRVDLRQVLVQPCVLFHLAVWRLAKNL